MNLLMKLLMKFVTDSKILLTRIRILKKKKKNNSSNNKKFNSNHCNYNKIMNSKTSINLVLYHNLLIIREKGLSIKNIGKKVIIIINQTITQNCNSNNRLINNLSIIIMTREKFLSTLRKNVSKMTRSLVRITLKV